jgi:hypothetical protein
MMNANYKLVFTVTVKHTFFQGDICNCLLFSPSTDTESLFKRFGFKIHSRNDGFDLYTTNDSIEDYINYIQSSTGKSGFDFQIQTTNPDFVLFTDLPVNWLGQILYSNSDPLNQLKDETVILNQTLSEDSSTNIGALNIQFADLIKGNKPSQEINYQINFEARPTQWQYYVVNKSKVLLDNPSITGKSKIAFAGPSNVTLPTNEEALLFTSETLIPLSEIAVNNFDLANNPAAIQNDKLKTKANPKIVFKGLPNANPSHFGIFSENGIDCMSSPMYIYL